LNAFSQRIDTATPQILTSLAQASLQDGKVDIIQPSEIEDLLKIQIENNKIKKGIPGYRIRIYSRAGQQNANQARMDFMRQYPSVNTYQEYNAPNFQIFIGDFRTKTAAVQKLKMIERSYPGAFIVTTTIQISEN
jgi:hypothetical protein